MEMQQQQTERRHHDVFAIEYDYRARARVKRSRLIRQQRREEAHPNGRKLLKRIRKYRPLYDFNSYCPDQPWDILVQQHRPQHEQQMEESIQVEKEFLRSDTTTTSMKEMQSMSKETICQSRLYAPSLFLQEFPPFVFADLE